MGAHAVMPAARPSSGCGILSWFVPPALAGEVAREAAAERDALLAAAGEKVPRRRARLLPPWLAVYFTLALCLLARLPYQDALRSLAGDGATGLAVPATTALTAARRRLGERPLELLFRRVAGVLLPSRDPWATVCGLLVAAWDGTTLKVPASPENTAALGRPRGGVKKTRGREGKASSVQGHYPHLRVVALIACGTRALLGAAIGPLADGEQTLAATLTARLRPGMLLLADRAYRGHACGRPAPRRRGPAVAGQVRYPPPRPAAAARRVLAAGGQRHPRGAPAEHAQRQPPQPRLPAAPGEKARSPATSPSASSSSSSPWPARTAPPAPSGTGPSPPCRTGAATPQPTSPPPAPAAGESRPPTARPSPTSPAAASRAPAPPASPARKPGPSSSPTRPSAPSSATPPPAGTDPGRLSFTTALHAARRTLGHPDRDPGRRGRDPRQPPPRPPAPHLRTRPRRAAARLPAQEGQAPAATTAHPLHGHRRPKLCRADCARR